VGGSGEKSARAKEKTGETYGSDQKARGEGGGGKHTHHQTSRKKTCGEEASAIGRVFDGQEDIPRLNSAGVEEKPAVARGG